MKFDPAYVDFITDNHGGIPIKQWFNSKDGRLFRIGRYVNFGGPYTPPYQDSWEFPGRDHRMDWSHEALETIANIADGCAAFLIPFGILYSGDHHPDDMGVIYSNMLCFDYKNMHGTLPSVAAWINANAVTEYCRLQEQGVNPFLEMDHSNITHPVADCFADFLRILMHEQPA